MCSGGQGYARLLFVRLWLFARCREGSCDMPVSMPCASQRAAAMVPHRGPFLFKGSMVCSGKTTQSCALEGLKYFSLCSVFQITFYQAQWNLTFSLITKLKNDDSHFSWMSYIPSGHLPDFGHNEFIWAVFSILPTLYHHLQISALLLPSCFCHCFPPVW